MPHDKNNWPLDINDVAILRVKVIRKEKGEDYQNLVVETIEPMFPTDTLTDFSINSRQLERVDDAITAQQSLERLQALNSASGQEKLDFIIKTGDTIAMSLATLQTKVDALVAAQTANSAAVVAEIARIEAAVAAVQAIPADTTAIEAQLQTVIANLTAASTALDAAAVVPPAEPTP